MEQSFLGLVNERFIPYLEKENIKTPTEIQQKSIPICLSGKDLVASSATGTGKTLAYLLPIFERIDLSIKTPQAIILTPTHELAAQVFKHAKLLKEATGISPALIVGGASLKRQMERLKEKPHIIIGSAGRILELIKIKKLSAHTVKTIVIDEADRMLDNTNLEEVKKVIKTTLKDRQLLFFSASISAETMMRIAELAKDPQAVNTSKKMQMPPGIEHFYFLCERRKKIEVLRKLVHSANITKAIVFLNNQDSIETMVKRLNYHGMKAVALYGAALKKERKQALLDFTDGRATLLVASDIAARGLDIKGITHIIHLDMPEEPVFYLHRAGRTGRMGEQGMSFIIAEQREVRYIKKCEKKLSIDILQKEIRFGEIVASN